MLDTRGCSDTSWRHVLSLLQPPLAATSNRCTQAAAVLACLLSGCVPCVLWPSHQYCLAGCNDANALLACKARQRHQHRRQQDQVDILPVSSSERNDIRPAGYAKCIEVGRHVTNYAHAPAILKPSMPA
jgi:hypothetical protein